MTPSERSCWCVCADVNECVDVVSTCGVGAESCVNDAGGYTCSCRDGYEFVDGTCAGNRSPLLSVAGPMAWNSLPDFIRNPTSCTDCLGVYLKRTCCSRVASASSALGGS